MKTLRELKDYDTISIEKYHEEVQDFIRNVYDDNRDLEIPLYLPLTELVLKVFNRDNKGVFFYAKEIEEEYYLEAYTYDKYNYDFDYVATFRVIDISKNTPKQCYKIIDWNKEYYRTEADAFKYLFEIYRTFVGCLIYIIYLKDNPKIRYTTTRSKTEQKDSPVSNNVRKHTKVVINGSIVYNLSVSSNNLKYFKKSYNRHCESWKVMGHTRRLKNGKTIFVKPHTRGVGKIEKKDYLVK